MGSGVVGGGVPCGSRGNRSGRGGRRTGQSGCRWKSEKIVSSSSSNRSASQDDARSRLCNHKDKCPKLSTKFSKKQQHMRSSRQREGMHHLGFELIR